MDAEQLKTLQGHTVDGPLIIKPKVFGDERGWFFESWNQKKFNSAIGENVIFSQERVLPGNILYELLNNKRIIGVRDSKSQSIAKKIFGKIVNSKMSFTNLKMAEMIKLSENTYLP